MEDRSLKSSEIKEAISELQTILDILRWSVTQFTKANLFFGHGTDNAWDEAAALIFAALHLPHELFNQVVNSRLTQSEKTILIQLIKKRIESRLPLPYLTHEAWFAGHAFYVDERVLIPRSPIAELIEEKFETLYDSETIKNLLDLGTGSGCIAIASALALPHAKIDAIDISKEALQVAKINVERYNLQNQVTLIESDLFSGIAGRIYEIIIANPPYVDAMEMSNLPAEYQYEPQLALAAGPHGLDVVKNILKQAANYLSPNGILIVEVGLSAKALEETYPTIDFLWIDFERGGGGVFLLTQKQLMDYKDIIKAR